MFYVDEYLRRFLRRIPRTSLPIGSILFINFWTSEYPLITEIQTPTSLSKRLDPVKGGNS